jgi:signal transduction histidine kinase
MDVLGAGPALTDDVWQRRLLHRKAIAEAVQSTLDTAVIVERTVGHLLEIATADRVTLSRIEDGDLVILSSRDREGDPPWRGLRIPLERLRANPRVATVLSERRTLSGDAFEFDPESPFAEELSRARHTALIPLVARDEVIGLIALSRRSGEPFTDNEVTDLEITANVAALALRNARLYQQAEAAAAARSAFLNLAAHELRTPFAVISGYLSLLAEGDFGPPPQEWLRPLAIVRDKTAELGRLIDQILTASRAESGHFALELEPLNLGTAVQAAISRARPRIELHGGQVWVSHDSNPSVRADAGAIGIILDNLLNNAVTYRLGEPRIEVVIEGSSGGDRDVASVRVLDNGRGIAEEDAERIFEQFSRVEIRDLPTPAGTGLGLYIARRLAEAMGGSLSLLRSQLGRGSEFALLLPAVEPRTMAASERRGEGRTHPSGSAGSARRAARRTPG